MSSTRWISLSVEQQIKLYETYYSYDDGVQFRVLDGQLKYTLPWYMDNLDSFATSWFEINNLPLYEMAKKFRDLVKAHEYELIEEDCGMLEDVITQINTEEVVEDLTPNNPM